MIPVISIILDLCTYDGQTNINQSDRQEKYGKGKKLESMHLSTKSLFETFPLDVDHLEKPSHHPTN